MRASLSTTEKYYSSLAPKELLKLMQLVTASPSEFIGFPMQTLLDKTFMGEVGENSFDVRRIIRYSNPMQPRIIGGVEGAANDKNSRLRIRYQVPSWLLIIQTLSITTVVSLGVWHFVVNKVVAGAAPFLIGFGLLMLLFMGGVRAFWAEVRASRRALERLLNIEKTSTS